jgi:hypothetical protein
VKLWEAVDTQRSRISPILKEIKDRSAAFFDFSLMYANRSCNQVAHVLARQVSDDIRMGEWHSAPSGVLHLLTEDCNPVDS